MSITSTPKLKILISGAGIAGPCLAYWLTKARFNATITIVERSPFPRLTGQSIDIHGGAIEIVKKMNLEEAIRARHTSEEGTEILSSSGKQVAFFKAGDTFTAQYEILRADLAELFAKATQDLSNVRYVYDESVDSMEEMEDNVNVTFASGSKDMFDLVVAADGSTSKIRSTILDEHTLKGSYNFLGQYIAFFSIPSQQNDTKLWQIFNTTKGLSIMMRPHRSGSTIGVYLCITMPAHGTRDLEVEAAMEKGTKETKQMLHQYFQNVGWQAERVLEGLDTADDFYMSKAAQVKLPKWTSRRSVVIGDAAFATFGVGTTLAIESGYLLAGELSKIGSSNDIPEALQRYEDVFRPLYKKMEDLPPKYPQIAFPQTAWGLRLLKSTLWFISKTKAHKLIPNDDGTHYVLPKYDWVNL